MEYLLMDIQDLCADALVSAWIFDLQLARDSAGFGARLANADSVGEAAEYEKVAVFPRRLSLRRCIRKPEVVISGQLHARSGHSNDCDGRFVDAHGLPDQRFIFVVTAFPDTVRQERDGRRSGLRIRRFQIAPEQRFLANDGQCIRRYSRDKITLRKVGVIAQVDIPELKGGE